MLNAEQIRFFKTQGYLIVPGCHGYRALSTSQRPDVAGAAAEYFTATK
jgi:hypothetical protein